MDLSNKLGGYTLKYFKKEVTPPRARWTYSAVLDGVYVYLVQDVHAQPAVDSTWSESETHGRIIALIGFESMSPTIREYFFPAGRPTVELMDRLADVVEKQKVDPHRRIGV